MIEDREGPETCNTYNMLKLTKALAEAAFEPSHLDFAERAIYNHQLASQHPEHGGFVYFTPMRPRHYRVYSQPELGMWCCVGTGIEAQAKYGEFVFGEHEGALAVNLYIPAELDAPEFGGRFRLETAFPADEHIGLTLDLEAPRAFALRLRVPGWSDGLTDLKVNGRPVECRGTSPVPSWSIGHGGPVTRSLSASRSGSEPNGFPTAPRGRRTSPARSCSPPATARTIWRGCGPTTPTRGTCPSARCSASPTSRSSPTRPLSRCVTREGPLRYRHRTSPIPPVRSSSCRSSRCTTAATPSTGRSPPRTQVARATP